MLVDDHEVVRDGIKLLLADTEDVVVCAEASSAREAVAVAAQSIPDVIVMDVRLQDGSGIEATLKDFLDRLGHAITLSQPGGTARMRT